MGEGEGVDGVPQRKERIGSSLTWVEEGGGGILSRYQGTSGTSVPKLHVPGSRTSTPHCLRPYLSRSKDPSLLLLIRPLIPGPSLTFRSLSRGPKSCGRVGDTKSRD